VWPASALWRCAARPSPAQPALSIIVRSKHWLQISWQNNITLQSWSHIITDDNRLYTLIWM
jgi:hypothetical protein